MEMELQRLRERAHIVEGLVWVAEDRVELVLTTARASDRREAINDLMSIFRLSEMQAVHALDMPFGRMTKLGREHLGRELAELKERIVELEE